LTSSPQLRLTSKVDVIPDVLDLAASQGRILVSHDKRTVPGSEARNSRRSSK